MIDLDTAKNDVDAMDDQRQKQILNAARTLFFERGLRATTMEAISDSAGVSKPTLYNRYKDKNAVFQSVVVSILDELRALMDAEFSKPGSIEDRLTTALIAKYCAVFDMLQSPHAAQMMEDKVIYAGHAFQKLNNDVATRIESMTAQAGYSNPSSLTRLILACAAGIHKNARTRDEVAHDLKTVVHALWATSK
jgi:AcrR family transcriptional regulator